MYLFTYAFKMILSSISISNQQYIKHFINTVINNLCIYALVFHHQFANIFLAWLVSLVAKVSADLSASRLCRVTDVSNIRIRLAHIKSFVRRPTFKKNPKQLSKKFKIIYLLQSNSSSKIHSKSQQYYSFKKPKQNH